MERFYTHTDKGGTSVPEHMLAQGSLLYLNLETGRLKAKAKKPFDARIVIAVSESGILLVAVANGDPYKAPVIGEHKQLEGALKKGVTSENAVFFHGAVKVVEFEGRSVRTVYVYQTRPESIPGLNGRATPATILPQTVLAHELRGKIMFTLEAGKLEFVPIFRTASGDWIDNRTLFPPRFS